MNTSSLASAINRCLDSQERVTGKRFSDPIEKKDIGRIIALALEEYERQKENEKN